MSAKNTNQPKILLVDDEPDILEFLKYNIEKEGFIVYTASNGKDGVAEALKHTPQLILLDVMMPGMDGIETCHALRESSKLKDTVIAFLTARSEDYSQIAGFEAGADDYIIKPIRHNRRASINKGCTCHNIPYTLPAIAIPAMAQAATDVLLY